MKKLYEKKDKRRVGLASYNSMLLKNKYQSHHKVFIATPCTGLVRMEWAMARFGQIIPCNWSYKAGVMWTPAFAPMGYLVADAQNLAVRKFISDNSEWCFKPHTYVETILGSKKIQDIKVGELVKTHTGKFSKVNKVLTRHLPIHRDLMWITTLNCVTKCTPEHPFYVLRNSIHSFIEAKDLNNKDLLLYPFVNSKDNLDLNLVYNKIGNGYNNLVGSKRNAKVTDNILIDKDWARFLGLFLAEGNVNRDGLQFTFNNKENDYINFIKSFSLEKFGRNVTISKNWATRIKLSITNLSPIFESWFGKLAKNKKVPSFVFNWNLINKLEFIRGYLDGDGSYQKGLCSFSSASKQLTKDIKVLAKSCGLNVTKITYMNPTTSVYKGKEIKNTGYYTARLNKNILGKMFDILNSEILDNYLGIKIKKIEKHKQGGNLKDYNVYNLEVDGDNSYIVNSSAVHNCMFIEQDNVLPPDCFLRFNDYIRSKKVPIVSGLYFTKTVPGEPMVYRGRGNSYYTDWKIGDKIWVDAVPMGCVIIHRSILEALWNNSPEYKAGDQVTRRVFHTPQTSWFDPQVGVNNTVGTSDMELTARIIMDDIFTKAGWPKYAKKQYPFLIDSNIFCDHIDTNGILYPNSLEKQYWSLDPKKRK